MRAVLMRADGTEGFRAEVADVPRPSIGREEMLVEMRACGLCGTDIEKMRGHYTASMPVLGHEAVGVIAEVGEGLDGFKKGDRVFPHHHVPCYECYYCRMGSETMCDHYRTSNIHPGGFSEFFRVPAWNVMKGGVLKLPKSLDFDSACMIEPAACCLRGIRRCGVLPDDNVLVVGAGPVGMTHALILKSLGAKVIVSDVSSFKLGLAESLGKFATIDAKGANLSAEVRGETSGRGADVVVVATGDLKAIAQGLDSVRKGGTVCLFGVPAAGSSLDYDISKVFNSEVRITTSYGSTDQDTREVLEMMSGGRLDLGGLVTSRFPIERFDEAVRAAVSGDAMKVVVTN